MVGIGGTGRLREGRQHSGHCAVMMPGAIAFMMQHKSHPILARLKQDVMVRIKFSEENRSRNPHRRQRAYIQQQPAPTRQKAEGVAWSSTRSVHLDFTCARSASGGFSGMHPNASRQPQHGSTLSVRLGVTDLVIQLRTLQHYLITVRVRFSRVPSNRGAAHETSQFAGKMLLWGSLDVPDSHSVIGRGSVSETSR